MQPVENLAKKAPKVWTHLVEYENCDVFLVVQESYLQINREDFCEMVQETVDRQENDLPFSGIYVNFDDDLELVP